MESERVAARLRPPVHGWPLSTSFWRAACAGPTRLGGGLHDSTTRTALPHLGWMPGHPVHDSILLKDWSRHQTRDGSRDQSQHQRGYGEPEARSRRADRVVAYAQVGDDGTDEEQDEADCGGRPDQWHADEADQQSNRARCFEDAQHGQPRFRHAYLGCGDEDEFVAHKIGGGREGVSGDGHQGDNDVGGKHSELQLFLDVPSFRHYLTTCVPREAGLLVISLSHRPGLVRHYYNDTTRLETVTDGRTRRLASTALRGEPDPPESGGLPDARLDQRGGRRPPGSLATPQPLGHQRHREPGRMADDSRRAGVPKHAAFAPLKARGAPGRAPGGRARARTDREPRGWGRPRARGAAGRLGRAGAARGTRNALSRRA